MDLRSSPAGGGDLGRRITEQRENAGLSRPQTAERAGMAAGYLRYLETSPAPRPAPGDLDRSCFIKIVASEISGRRIRRTAGHPTA
jgi:transcriptional regulator with XRE-family HTH domain